jgi:hypothetical protein
MALELLALVCTTLFAGASLYASVVEHSARLGCGTAVALTEWRPSYKRAAVMQVTLGVVALLAAIGAYPMGRGLPVLLGALLLATVVPFTLVVIMPTNKELLNPTRGADTPDTATLLEHWGRLHAVRTVVSLLAVGLLVAHLLGQG